MNDLRAIKHTSDSYLKSKPQPNDCGQHGTKP